MGFQTVQLISLVPVVCEQPASVKPSALTIFSFESFAQPRYIIFQLDQFLLGLTSAFYLLAFCFSLLEQQPQEPATRNS
jgi:hypothetical protein